MPANTIRSTFTGRTWAEASEFSHQRRGPQEPRRICPNTYFLEFYTSFYSAYAISYYDTILVIYKRESIIINTGGHRTASTLRRLRQFLPRHLNAYRQGLWFIEDTTRSMGEGRLKQLVDGMEISCPQQ